MADPKVPRYNRDRSTWSVEDHVRFNRDGSLPINPEWTKQLHEAAACFNLEDPIGDTAEGKPPEDLTTEEHLGRIQGGRT